MHFFYTHLNRIHEHSDWSQIRLVLEQGEVLLSIPQREEIFPGAPGPLSCKVKSHANRRPFPAPPRCFPHQVSLPCLLTSPGSRFVTKRRKTPGLSCSPLTSAAVGASLKTMSPLKADQTTFGREAQREVVMPFPPLNVYTLVGDLSKTSPW